jgi:hypothetical protein
MKIKPNRKLKLVLIEWEDITSPAEIWVDVDEDMSKFKTSKCLTIGFIVKRTKTHIYTAQNYSMDRQGNEQWGDLEILPKGVVLSIKEWKGALNEARKR